MSDMPDPALDRVNSDCYPSDSLDAAWVEAEAVLPDGAFLVLSDDPSYIAEATKLAKEGEGGYVVLFHEEAMGPTPAAALRALAEKLRASKPRTWWNEQHG